MNPVNPTDQPTLPIALIGVGNFARHQHLPNLARLPQADLRWICDLDQSVLEEQGNRYSVQATKSINDILDDPSVRAVVIALPENLQASVSDKALKAGKHVYVEKPLARTVKEAQSLSEVVQQTGKRLAVGFNRRYAPMYRKIKTVVDAHGISSVHFRMCDDAWRWAGSHEPGFLMGLDIGHLFDTTRWLTGSEVASVCCFSSRPDDEQVLLKLRDETVVSIMLSGHGSMDMPKERCEVMGNKGGLIGEDFVELRTYGYADEPYRQTFAGHPHPDHGFLHQDLFKQLGAEGLARVRRSTWEQRQKVFGEVPYEGWDRDEIVEHVRKTIPNFMRNQGWMASMAAFIDGILKDQPTDHAGVEDALASARILEAVIKSRDTGQTVQVDT